MVMATSLLFGACSGDGKTCDRATQQKGNTENVIGRRILKSKTDGLTPEVLWAMGTYRGDECISGRTESSVYCSLLQRTGKQK